MVILGSYFDILGILGILDKCAVFVFHLSLSFFFLESFAESCFFSFWGGTRKKTNKRTNERTESLVDRGGGIWDFQHCIVITRGQEERIPKTASVVGTNFGLRSFSLCLLFFFGFFVFFIDFNRFLWVFNDLDGFWMILGSDFDILGFLKIWGNMCRLAFHLSLSFYFAGEFC